MADDDAADEFDEADVPEELDEDLDEELDEELDEDLGGGLEEDLVDEETLATGEDEDEGEEDGEARPARPAATDDDEDEVDPDDVEADLDTILKDRIAANDDEEDEDEEEAAPTGRASDTGDEAGGRVAPRKAGEFVCSSCFLVKPNTQLADAKAKLCLDCV